jgi:hypothetical protein
MTRTDRTPDAPLPEYLSVVAAFLDGEPVDAAALKQTLATEDARDYLVDVLVLRQCVAAMGPIAFRIDAQRPRRSQALRWAAVATVALIASIGGYLAGERAGLVTEVQGARSSVEAVATFEPSGGAPQPTQVIQLQVGVASDASEGN